MSDNFQSIHNIMNCFYSLGQCLIRGQRVLKIMIDHKEIPLPQVQNTNSLPVE